jgi:hypothetical protein
MRRNPMNKKPRITIKTASTLGIFLLCRNRRGGKHIIAMKIARRNGMIIEVAARSPAIMIMKDAVKSSGLVLSFCGTVFDIKKV